MQKSLRARFRMKRFDGVLRERELGGGREREGERGWRYVPFGY